MLSAGLVNFKILNFKHISIAINPAQHSWGGLITLPVKPHFNHGALHCMSLLAISIKSFVPGVS